MSKRIRIGITEEHRRELDEWITAVNNLPHFYKIIINKEPEHLQYYRNLTMKCYATLLDSVAHNKYTDEFLCVGISIYIIALKNVLGFELLYNEKAIMDDMVYYSNKSFSIKQLIQTELEMICSVNWNEWSQFKQVDLLILL